MTSEQPMGADEATRVVGAVALAVAEELAAAPPAGPRDPYTHCLGGLDSGIRLTLADPELARRFLEAEQVAVFDPEGEDFGTHPDSLAQRVLDALGRTAPAEPPTLEAHLAETLPAQLEAALGLLVQHGIHGGLLNGYCAVCQGQCMRTWRGPN